MGFGPSALRGALVALAVLAAGAPAASAVSLEHVQVTATETAGDGDGLVRPGETFSLTERIRHADLLVPSLTGVFATLSYVGGGSPAPVTLLQDDSAYPNLTFGQEADNTTPFSATLSGAAECGIVLDFRLEVTSAQGSAQVPFKLGTGAPGPPVAYDSADVPQPVPDLGTATSTLDVGQAGRVKDLEVRIGDLHHTATGDLRIELVAPDGASVVLFEGEGSAGDDLLNTVFSDSASQSIEGASAPFEGTFRPVQPLSTLAGRSQLGQWTLRVSDERGSDEGQLNAWGMDLRSAVCDGDPIASFLASPNPVLPGQPTTLDASASLDPNGTIVKYEWDLDDDGTFEVDNGADPTLDHSFAVRGSYPVRLRVTDGDGDTGTTTVDVSVTEPPVAALSALPASPLSGQETTLDGSASSDPEGAPLARFEWDLDGDGSFERDTGTASSTTTSYASPGTRTVRLRVTDEDGATDVETLALVVQNRPPTASFTKPSPAVVGQSASFDGSGSSDPDGTVVLYQWDFQDDGTFDASGASPTASHVFAASGDVQVRLRVTDSDGATHDQVQTVRATRAPVASFTATPNPVSLHVPVSLDASGSSDPDGVPLARFEWDLDGNGSYETDTGATPAASRTFNANGTVAIRLRVTDVDGASATHTVSVTAANQSPAAVVAAAPNPAVAGQAVVLDGTGSSDSDGTIVKYDWDLDGNGTFEATSFAVPTRTHVYPNPGVFNVGLRVTDNDGATRTAAVPLTVSSPPSGVTGGTGDGGSDGAAGGATGGATGADGGATAGGGSGSGPAALTASLEGNPIQRLRTVLARGLAVACAADRAVACTLRVELRAADARRLGLRVSRGRPVVVGSVRLALAGEGRRAARVRLTPAGRHGLRRARTVSLAIRGSAVDAQGARVALSRTFLLRR